MGRKQRRRREAKELERAGAVERPWLGAADLVRMAVNMGISVEQFERHTRSLQAKGFMEVRQRFDAARGETLTQLDDRAFFRRVGELHQVDAARGVAPAAERREGARPRPERS